MPPSKSEEIDCALCGSSNPIPVLSSKSGLFLARCAQCDFHFYSPRPRIDQIESYYHGEDFYQKVNITAVEIVMEILAHHKIQPGKLLDVGCGVGSLVALLQKLGWQSVGMDTSPKAAELAKRELGLDILQAHLGDTTFEPETFNVVVLLAVLEHVVKPVDMMAQVWDLLKPGGLVVFSLPNLDNLSYILMPNKAEYSWFIKEHINHFTLKTLRTLLQKTGFRNINFHMCGHFTLEGAGDNLKLTPGPGYVRVVRKMLPHVLNPLAREIFSKEGADLTDLEVLEAMAQQANAWKLPPGEYSVSDAVYVSAFKVT